MPDSPGRITLWGIEVFLACAEERSISVAARRLGASASAVSQQITKLEEAVGKTLLERSARPVGLTPAGEILRRRAQVIMNEAAQARAELSGSDMAALTRLRLGMVEDFEADVTPRLLTELAGALKNCQFQLETGASHMLHDLLDTRALDVIVAAEMGAQADWMEVHPLLTEQFVLALPKGAAVEGDLLTALKPLPLILYTQRHYIGRLIAGHLARQNLTMAHRFELDSYHAILAMVAQGTGWTILPPLALMRGRRYAGQIDVHPMPFEPLTRDISLIARKEILQDMPTRVGETLRGILRETMAAPDLPARAVLETCLHLH